MSVYDCFTFFNELDLLDIRLHELDPVVDYFVIVEATKTHSGQPKPLMFSQNRHNYAAFSNKIIHVVVDDMPPVIDGDRWPLENHQRRCIARGLTACCGRDIIAISDLDEIPDRLNFSQVCSSLDHRNWLGRCAEAFFGACRRASDSWQGMRGASRLCRVLRRISDRFLFPNICVFSHRLYYYYLNGYMHDHWFGTTALTYSTFSTFFSSDAQRVRMARKTWGTRTVRRGGWHFSYLGGAARIAEKISGFAHGEFDAPQYTDTQHIEACIERGEDIYGVPGHDCPISYVDLDTTLPSYVLLNRDKFMPLIKHDQGR